jgi:CHAT domain-containing protein/tetratricopeptide (TPR) repeat protein
MMQNTTKCILWAILACGPGANSYSLDSPVSQHSGSVWLERANAHFASRQIDSASSAYQQACSSLFEEKAWAEYAAALNGLGKADLHRGRFAEAISTLNTALEVEEQNTECSAFERAQTCNLLGYAYMALGQWEKSRHLVETGLSIRVTAFGENSPQVGSSQYMLGVIFYKLGDHQTATLHLEEALRLQAVAPGVESSDFASTLVTRGMILCDRREFQAAVQTLTRAADIFSKINDTRSGTVGACCSYLANAYASLGERSLALEWANRSLDIYRQSYGQFHSELAGTYAVLGKIHAAIGDYDRTEECYKEARKLLTQAFGENSSRVGQVEWLLGSMYLNKHDLNAALHHSLLALSILTHSLDVHHPDVTNLYKHLGSVYRQRNQSDSAMACFARALEGASKNTNAIEEAGRADIFTNMGQLFAHAGSFDSALTYLQASLDIQHAHRNQDPLILSKTHRAIGDLLTGKSLHREALLSYQRALQALRQNAGNSSWTRLESTATAGYGRERLNILCAIGRTYRVLAERGSTGGPFLSNALSVYESAATLVEHLRKSYAREGSKFFLAEESIPLFEEGIQVSLDLFRLTQDHRYAQTAFSFAERSKAGILSDNIRQAEAMQYAGIPDSLLNRLRQLRSEIVFCERQLEQQEGERPAPDRSVLEEKLFGFHQAKTEIEERLEVEYPTYRALRFGGPEATVKSVQKILDGETTFVSYFMGTSFVRIFVIGSNSFNVVTVPHAADLELRVQRVCTAIRTLDTKAYPVEAHAVYQKLVRPIEKFLGNRRRIVIIPDGCLYNLPFEALVTSLPVQAAQASGTWDYARLPFLIRSREISYAHSARLFAHVHADSGARTVEDQSFVGYAPVFRDTASGRGDSSNHHLIASSDLSETRSVSVKGRTFRELKHSEAEVRGIAADFHTRGHPGVTYIDADATEESFKQNAVKYRYIHLATHSYVDQDHPNLSAIMFSPGPAQLLTGDGMLYMGEVHNLRLNADLLVLSSCESGVGKLAKGEGVLAFTRGFQNAGARNIVYSLWRVLDKQTSMLMQRFYDRVLDGRRVSQALREAKLQMIRNRATAFPLAWAGFVLLGES